MEMALAELKRLANESDVRACLMYLNGRTGHRFSALYRFDGGTLNNPPEEFCREPCEVIAHRGMRFRLRLRHALGVRFSRCRKRREK
jgi:hypothetical protein